MPEQRKPNEFTPAEAEAVIAKWPWTPANWAQQPGNEAAAHEYVMHKDVDGDDYYALYKFIRRVGYRARWGPNPQTGKSFSNVYYEAEDGWTVWWTRGCFNREHVSTPTLRVPASAAEAAERDEAQLALDDASKGGAR